MKNYNYIPKVSFGTKATWVIPLPKYNGKTINIKTPRDLKKIAGRIE